MLCVQPKDISAIKAGFGALPGNIANIGGGTVREVSCFAVPGKETDACLVFLTAVTLRSAATCVLSSGAEFRLHISCVVFTCLELLPPLAPPLGLGGILL